MARRIHECLTCGEELHSLFAAIMHCDPAAWGEDDDDSIQRSSD